MRRVTIALGIGLAISPTAAFAYFDPGTGSLLIQAAVGGLAAVVVFWGYVKSRARALFAKGKSLVSRSPIDTDKSANDSLGE
jgi:hypothetical protein